MTQEKAGMPAPEFKSQPGAKPAPVPAHTQTVRKNRHERNFILAGAFVVFLTFVVKDAIRDYLRDFGDSVDKAETAYLIRQDIGGVRGQLRDVVDMLPKAKTSKSDRLAIRMMTALNTSDSDRITMENNKGLWEKLPDRIRQQDKKNLDAIESKLAEVENFIFDMGGVAAKNAGTSHDNLEALPILDKIDDDEVDLTFQIYDFSLDVLKQARAVQSRNEHWYTIATYASYVLYFLGLVLGLIGRFQGIEGVAEPND